MEGIKCVPRLAGLLAVCGSPPPVHCRQAVAQQRPKVVFLTSPNNPDGSMLADEDVSCAPPAFICCVCKHARHSVACS